MSTASNAAVGRGILKAVAATAVYGALHSGLASETAKGWAERAVGQRVRNAFYRPIFNAVAVVSTLALLAYVWRQPDRRLYQVRGRPAWIMRGGQLASAAFLGWAALSQDTLGFTGLPQLWAYFTRKLSVPAEPAAQGPGIGQDGRIVAAGPFARMRQPANVAFLPMLWLNPTMTVKWAAFNGAVTAYALLGSLHAEKLLRDAYGPAYAQYQRRVPMLLPTLHASPSD